MNKFLSLIIALLSWMAVSVQYLLMLKNDEYSNFEITIHFLSYFTMLTNLLVAVYFSFIFFHLLGRKKKNAIEIKKITAITIYILTVGLGYQILLRNSWSVVGIQSLTNEVLHSIVPLLVLLFWIMNFRRGKLDYSNVFPWLIYPLIFLIFILIHGYYSKFYPYPFFDVTVLGFGKVLINAFGVALFMILLSVFFIWMNRKSTQ